MSGKPEIDSHGTDVVCQILRGCDKLLLRKRLQNVFQAYTIYLYNVCTCATRPIKYITALLYMQVLM
jgi:hypothetical protein